MPYIIKRKRYIRGNIKSILATNGRWILGDVSKRNYYPMGFKTRIEAYEYINNTLVLIDRWYSYSTYNIKPKEFKELHIITKIVNK